jgi:hypothetical protein
MTRLLFRYQMLIGLADTSTGLLLIFDPALTLRLMRLQASADSLPFLSFIGAFVTSVGITCLYGARLALQPASVPKLEAVWLLTAITRGLVSKILAGSMETGWITVAITDGAITLVQAAGLAKGWLNDAA